MNEHLLKVWNLFPYQFRNAVIKPVYKWPREKLLEYNNDVYKRLIGHELDIDNPKSFTEKLQWYKFRYTHPDLKRIVDKCGFKEFIKEKLGDGYTIPMYGCYDSVKELEKAWDTLPETFILKSTISSAGKNMQVVKKKSEFDFKAFKKELNTWFDPKNTMLNSFCTAYFECKPRVLAEEYVTSVGNQLYDYKIFCFNGEPHYFYTAIDHFQGVVSKISFYDLDWNMLPVQYGEHENAKIDPPLHKQEMLEIAKKLSADFPFVRVDFFETEEKLYVAELTFYPGGGLIPYHPESFDYEMGEKLILPIKK